MFKNPIVIGILVAALTYAYMYWDAQKKHKKNPKAKKKPVNFITPAAIGLIVWFITSTYFDSIKVESRDFKLVNDAGQTFDSASYHLVGRGNIRLPPTDVFIDLAKF